MQSSRAVERGCGRDNQATILNRESGYALIKKVTFKPRLKGDKGV